MSNFVDILKVVDCWVNFKVVENFYCDLNMYFEIHAYACTRMICFSRTSNNR